jgi:branched-chain amino acid transport system substrate-binding protein
VVAVLGGLGSGLGGILAGCDGDETSTPAATVSPGQATTTSTSTSTSTSTTVASGPETGRDIKIGLVSSLTGPLALFGRADEWWTGFALQSLPDGLVCGDGRLHKFVFAKEDSRSDPGQAALMATRLISDHKVDLLMCSGGADLVNPVAAQAEALACPCLCSFVQWRSFVSGRIGSSGQAVRWSYAHAIGVEDIAAAYVDMWDRLLTNKKVGLLFPDSAGGRIWADTATGLLPAAVAAGYECFQPDLYPVSGGDYSAFISEFKKNGCEICCGAFTTSAFAGFWRQALAQEYRPKIMTVAEGLLFPHALEAIIPAARYFTAELLWQSQWPFVESITGKSCQEMAKDYMAKTGDHWIAPIGQYARFEWAVDAFKRVENLDDREEIVERVASAKLETCLGPIDFTAPVDASQLQSRRPAANVYKAPAGAGQWVPADSFGFEPALLSAGNHPGLPIQAVIRPMEYDS